MTGLRSMEAVTLRAMKRVLIVEDNDDNRKILVYRLRRIANVEIEEATNGLEAVRAVSAHAPDLIIMDVHMPVMNGLEATRRIRALGDDGALLPIIALTAEPLERADRNGVTDFIQKPIVDPDGLRAKVTYWLEHRHGEDSVAVTAIPQAAGAR